MNTSTFNALAYNGSRVVRAGVLHKGDPRRALSARLGPDPTRATSARASAVPAWSTSARLGPDPRMATSIRGGA